MHSKDFDRVREGDVCGLRGGGRTDMVEGIGREERRRRKGGGTERRTTTSRHKITLANSLHICDFNRVRGRVFVV